MQEELKNEWADDERTAEKEKSTKLQEDESETKLQQEMDWSSEDGNSEHAANENFVPEFVDWVNPKLPLNVEFVSSTIDRNNKTVAVDPTHGKHLYFFNFWNTKGDQMGVEILFKKADNGRKCLNEFISSMKRRVSLEDEFSKRIVKSVHKPALFGFSERKKKAFWRFEFGTLKEASIKVGEDIEEDAKAHVNFGKSIQLGIIIPCKKYLEEYGESLKNIRKEFDTVTRSMKDVTKKATKKKKDLDQLVGKEIKKSKVAPETKQDDMALDLKILAKEYHIARNNWEVMYHDTTMKLQTLEERRLRYVGAMLDRFSKFQKELLSELTAINEKILQVEVDTLHDIELFVDENSTGVKIPQRRTFGLL